MSLRSADSSRLGSSSRKSRWPALGCDDLPIVSRCLAARAGREYVIADVIMAVDVDSHSTSLARLLVICGVCRSRQGVRAVDSPVPGRWVVMSESWGCDVQRSSSGRSIRLRGGRDVSHSYGYIHMW